MFEARPMQPQDAYAVTRDMWAPGVAELERIGMAADPDKMAEFFIKKADCGFSLFAGGRLVAVMGAEEQNGVHYTWFMATSALQEVGREFVLWLRAFCDKQVAQRPGIRMEMYSASLHPNSDRWFKALRFERGDEDLGEFRHYKYAPKKELTKTV